MPQVFKTEKSVLIDLVELVQLTDSREAARIAVGKYLSKLAKPCPTPGCLHELSSLPFLCKGYRSRWYLFRMVGDEMKSATTAGSALSTQQICNVLESSNYPEKEPCRECKTVRRAYREALEGVFCHGCGFFIDYDHRQIGYTQEWTISEDLKLPPEMLAKKQCVVCTEPSVSAKFADYFFCSQECLEEWLSDPSRRQLQSTN